MNSRRPQRAGGQRLGLGTAGRPTAGEAETVRTMGHAGGEKARPSYSIEAISMLEAYI